MVRCRYRCSDRVQRHFGKLKTEQELLKVIKLESLGTLAGGIAHDFNNMLAALFGNIELAKAPLQAVSRTICLKLPGVLWIRQPI